MGTFKDRWLKLRTGRGYRVDFISAQAKQAIPYQIRALLKQQGISQDELAKRAGLTQGVISRAANPTYGNLSINTCVRIAGGFDVAFVGKFVPYHELDRWLDRLHDESIVPTFEEEDRHAETLFMQFDEDEHQVLDPGVLDFFERQMAKPFQNQTLHDTDNVALENMTRGAQSSELAVPQSDIHGQQDVTTIPENIGAIGQQQPRPTLADDNRAALAVLEHQTA